MADGLALLPVLLEVLSLEDEDLEDDEVDDEVDDDGDDVACSVALLMVEFVVELMPEFAVELVPNTVVFAMPPVPVVGFRRAPVIVELPEEPAAPVELLLDLDPGATTGVTTPLLEPEEAVEEGGEAVAEPVEDVEVEARAATALVGQVEQP